MKFLEIEDIGRPYTPEELKALRKKVQKISMAEYCPAPRPVNFEELVIEAVQIEDIINHPPKKHEIPEMAYPKSGLRSVSLYAFLRQFAP